MKRPSIDRVMGLLLMSGYTRSQIYDLISEFRRASSSELEYKLDRQYAFLREYDDVLTGGRAEWAPDNKTSANRFSKNIHLTDRESSSVEYELYSKIHEALGVRLGLSTSQIAQLISEELSLKYDHNVPPLSKKSLTNWLSRLLLNYSPSEILHIVATISNKFNSNARIDWPVRGDMND